MTAPPPLALDRWQDFAALAAHIAEERARAYPALVQAGTLRQGEADHLIFVARAIAEIWACARDPRRAPQRRYIGLTRDQAIGAIDTMIDNSDRRRRRRPDDVHQSHRIDQLRAMRWWHGRYPQPRAYQPGSFDPAPAGRVYALQMILNIAPDADDLAAAGLPAQGGGKAAA